MTHRPNDIVSVLRTIADARKTLPLWGNRFADELARTGRTIEALTVGDLLELIGRHADASGLSYAEPARGSSDAVEVAPGFSAPREQVELHYRALAYAEKHNMPYLDAVLTLEGGHR